MQKIIDASTAEQLLHDYQPGSSFFLSSSNQTLLAEGVFASVQSDPSHERTALIEHTESLLKEAKRSGTSQHPMVVGAIPFDLTKPSRLIVPLKGQWAGPLPFGQMKNQIDEPSGAEYDIHPVPTPEDYKHAVERGLDKIAAGELTKIVLSRSLHLTAKEKVDIPHLLRKLARHNPKGYTFAVDLSGQKSLQKPTETTGGKTLLGASPELLVSRSGLQVVANPLAGSAPRSGDPKEDQRRASGLLASVKDRHEHAVVVDAVAQALKPYCKTLSVPKEPSLLHTETLWHLSSEIKGELIQPSTTSLELALALHPTPAVCGTPTELARKAIHEIEPFDRGFFSGMVGWCDSKGDGEWIVTIRCAEAESHSLKLFAGAGVVEGSNPEKELAETTAKFRTMLLAMGLSSEKC
ncbi:isochorismate synthase DhbC [Melghirimyces algeriensis]|uniref:isochorismate synthase n=1 Tax=Melghirimyces algeriensis TaxID=910412 RepID=A0A521EW84_9BACL|nr:isochorismate synthase DhbC [Melghirimyces algeriensis]SMO88159.1 isochorismate synthase [Melghirimyces algeriensis]